MKSLQGSRRGTCGWVILVGRYGGMADMLVLETNDFTSWGFKSLYLQEIRMTEWFKVSDLKSDVVIKTTVSSNLTPACRFSKIICSFTSN